MITFNFEYSLLLNFSKMTTRISPYNQKNKNTVAAKLFTQNCLYGQGVKDNGKEWGSNVKKEQNGIIPFDEKMFKEDPAKWQAMMNERMAWLYNKHK